MCIVENMLFKKRESTLERCSKGNLRISADVQPLCVRTSPLSRWEFSPVCGHKYFFKRVQCTNVNTTSKEDLIRCADVNTCSKGEFSPLECAEMYIVHLQEMYTSIKTEVWVCWPEVADAPGRERLR